MIPELLKIGPRVTAIPVVHGNGDFAWEVRRLMMAHDFDCLAVPLPPSFKDNVLNATVQLPTPSVVVQRDWFVPEIKNERRFETDPEIIQLNEEFDAAFGGKNEAAELDEQTEVVSYVPVEPCQPVIAAIRTALGEHLPIHFIDMETSHFEAYGDLMPDAFALKRMPIERYAAAVLPSLRPPKTEHWRNRIQAMAWNLRQLSVDYRNILFVTGILEWPWIRQAFLDRTLRRPEDEPVLPSDHYRLNKNSLYFLMGEIPFITDLYERARSELGDEANINIDGVKEMLITARYVYHQQYKGRTRKITPKLLSQILKYTRNLSLFDSRFTPQLVDIIMASQQIAGDGFAQSVLETAKRYGFNKADKSLNKVGMSVNKMQLPYYDIVDSVSRLPGVPLVWRQLELVPKPDQKKIKKWKKKWNPYAQCSWPPEDQIIENFRQTVFERAKEVLGLDLVQTEKFTTSIRDGIDIRETVRHWYDNEIYVKIVPPTRGDLDVAVMLFDSPAHPRNYPWRTTWFAEHKNESTLAFYATDYQAQPVGPGICLATYGGAMFIYPPKPIYDIWKDDRFDFASTLEERLLAAACYYSEHKHVALVSSAPPGQRWRQIARRYKKTFVHLPLGRFSDSTIHQLRMVHVLNGHEVRSYAANFIRRV